MRHVARTHRVDLDWLFERINRDPAVFIKFVGTKEQLADIHTKGSFTAEAWLALLRLCMIFPISNFVPIQTNIQHKHTASVAIQTRSSSRVITKQHNFGLIAIAMANASEQKSLSGSVSDSNLRRELDAPTANLWGEPCSMVIESVINLGPYTHQHAGQV